jgi:hypothetical protein
MTENHAPAERPGHVSRRADCPTWCETDHAKFTNHSRTLARVENVGTVSLTSWVPGDDRRPRIMILSPIGASWNAVAVEAHEAADLAGMFDTLGAGELAAGVRAARAILDSAKADGPRAGSPVVVVAEARECRAKRYGKTRECSETPPAFDVVYRTYDEGHEIEQHPACFAHGNAELDRHAAAGGIAEVELVEVKS